MDWIKSLCKLLAYLNVVWILINMLCLVFFACVCARCDLMWRRKVPWAPNIKWLSVWFDTVGETDFSCGIVNKIPQSTWLQSDLVMDVSDSWRLFNFLYKYMGLHFKVHSVIQVCDKGERHNKEATFDHRQHVW